MNENVLAKAISELEEEIKEIRKEQELNTKAVELYSQTINQFETSLKDLEVTRQPPDITPFIQLVNTRFKEIEKVVAEKPVNVIHEKRILFYPEGDGQNFLKFIANKFVLYLVIAGSICLLFWIGAFYWKKNSENERFKTMYFYIYHNTDLNSQKYLQRTFKEFQSDSIYKIRKDKTIMGFKQPEKEKENDFLNSFFK